MKTISKVAKSIECSTKIRITYDRNSKEFQQTLTDFRDSIFKRATEEHIVQQVAFYALKYGSNRMIEGIGYISINGEKQGEPYSGIDLESDDFEFEFEVNDDLPY